MGGLEGISCLKQRNNQSKIAAWQTNVKKNERTGHDVRFLRKICEQGSRLTILFAGNSIDSYCSELSLCIISPSKT